MCAALFGLARGVVSMLVLGVAVALAIATPPGGRAASPGVANPPGVSFVASAEQAIRVLSRRPDALGFSREGLRAGTLCKHYQGMARTNGADGTPHLLLTKSGNTSICVLQNDEPGYFFSAALGSRNKAGERLGTNLLPYGSSGFSAYPQPLATFAEDKIVRELVFDGDDLPAYRHPGGMQVVGDVVAIGAEEPFNGETSRATIVFIDVSDPAHPTYLTRFDPPDLTDPPCVAGSATYPACLLGIDLTGDFNSAFGTDPVGMTAVKNADGTCCRYLMIAAGGEGNRQVRFFLSRPDSGSTTTTLKSPALAWDQVGRYSEGTLERCMEHDWPTAGLIQGGQHQMLNFVREGSLDGQLYLVGGRRDGIIANPLADEYLDLYRVNLTSGGVPAPCPLTHVISKIVSEDSWATEEEVSSLAAAAGVYVSPTGELIVYSTRHEAKILSFGGLTLQDHVPVGEYRDTALVADGSPTLHPSAELDGPFSVDEGSAVQLTGRGTQALQKAFVQLFEDGGVGSSLPGALDDDEWISIEWETRNDDAFGDLDQLGGGASEIWDNAGSLRWYAPVGCTISANDYPTRSDEWPGPDTVLLRGTGQMVQDGDLEGFDITRSSSSPLPLAPVLPGETAETVDIDDDIEGVTFADDCAAYYAAPISLAWDLQPDGSFETTGASVPFSAVTFDGPSTRVVNARAKHPTDPTERGEGPVMPVPVTIRNVAPVIGSSSIVDSLGRSVASGGVAIRGLPVTLSVDFTDPGRPDTQTGHVSWGDGTTSTAFDVFTGATGGVTGRLRQAHVFTQAGTFTVVATITDDDDGATPVQWTVTVLTLEGAIQHVADDLTTRIGQAANQGVAAALKAARDELIGNLTGRPPTNGALDKLEAGDPVGAITKLKAAIAYLATAEARGAGDLSALKDLLGLVAEGIATEAYEKARVAVGTGSAGQQKALATIRGLIQQGHQHLLARRYAEGCEALRQATEKAAALVR